MTQIDSELFAVYGIPGLALSLIIWQWREKIKNNGSSDPSKIIMSKLDSIEKKHDDLHTNQRETNKKVQELGERLAAVEAIQNERKRD